MGVPGTRLAHPCRGSAKQNLQIQLCKREVTARKMSLSWGTAGNHVCRCRGGWTEPTKSRGRLYPGADAIPYPHPHGSQGTAVDGTAARVLSLLLLSPLWAEKDVKGKKKNNTANPKGQRTNSNLPGRKGQLRDARGGAQRVPRIVHHCPEPKCNNAIY